MANGVKALGMKRQRQRVQYRGGGGGASLHRLHKFSVCGYRRYR